MIITRTPFRISFFGGGTDFPDYYLEHGGSVLTTSTNQYCFISVHTLGPFFKYRMKANYAIAETVDHPGEFKHPLIRETLLMLGVDQRLEISHIADLPARAGIGSSSSFTVGLLHALHELKGEKVGAEQLANEAIRVERELVQDTGGHQDQIVAAYGGFLKINFLKGGGFETIRLDITRERIQELQDSVMLFYTGLESSAEAILTEQKKQIKKKLNSLHEMRAIADEAEAILTGSGDLDGFGKLLHETWTKKKSLASGITNPLIDEAYGKALGAGALGGKLLGAGGRGFLLVYARPSLHGKIREELRGLAEVGVAFSEEGSEVIFNNHVSL